MVAALDTTTICQSQRKTFAVLTKVGSLGKRFKKRRENKVCVEKKSSLSQNLFPSQFCGSVFSYLSLSNHVHVLVYPSLFLLACNNKEYYYEQEEYEEYEKEEKEQQAGRRPNKQPQYR